MNRKATLGIFPDVTRLIENIPVDHVAMRDAVECACAAEAVADSDILVVMSDHGIATGLKHDERAMWIVNGPGIPVLRLPDTPDLRGVPAALASLVGMRTDWPATGLH